MAAFMAENKRWRSKIGGKYQPRRPLGGRFSEKPLLGGSSIKRQGTMTAAIDSDNKTPLKKKNTMTFKRSTTNCFPGEVEFAKSRKNSLLIGNTREDQTKRYQQMVTANGYAKING